MVAWWAPDLEAQQPGLGLLQHREGRLQRREGGSSVVKGGSSVVKGGSSIILGSGQGPVVGSSSVSGSSFSSTSHTIQRRQLSQV